MLRRKTGNWCGNGGQGPGTGGSPGHNGRAGSGAESGDGSGQRPTGGHDVLKRRKGNEEGSSRKNRRWKKTQAKDAVLGGEKGSIRRRGQVYNNNYPRECRSRAGYPRPEVNRRSLPPFKVSIGCFPVQTEPNLGGRQISYPRRDKPINIHSGTFVSPSLPAIAMSALRSSFK